MFCNGREVRVQNDSTIDGKIRNAGRRDDEIDFFLVEYVMPVNYPAGMHSMMLDNLVGLWRSEVKIRIFDSAAFKAMDEII